MSVDWRSGAFWGTQVMLYILQPTAIELADCRLYQHILLGSIAAKGLQMKPAEYTMLHDVLASFLNFRYRALFLASDPNK